MLCVLFVTRQCQSAGSTSTNAGTTTSATSVGTTTVDPRGIPCWEKVGQLAEELLSLTDIAVSMAQADRFKALYNALEPYDKKVIEVHLRSQQLNLRGRFCSQKSSSGHTSREQMRKFIYIYIYIYTHTHTHTHIYIYMYL